MDHFGIGAAIRGSMLVYLQSSRNTGRTTSLVDSVKDGDRICFLDSQEAHRVEKLLAERGVSVECIVIHPSKPEEIFTLTTPQGRTIFDHSWLEAFYLLAIDRAVLAVDSFEQRASGYGEIHRNTRRKAIELAKWRIG